MSRTSNKMFMLFASAALAGTLAVTMSGCSAPEEPANEANGNEAASTISGEPDNTSSEVERTAAEELTNPLPLEISDYGWFASDNNMVDFSVVIDNANKYVTAKDAVLTVSGVNADGDVFFTEDISLADIPPENEYVFSYVTGDQSADAQVPESLAFSINVESDGWYVSDSETPSYVVDDVAVSPSDIEGVDVITGNVKADEDASGQVMVNTVLYDENEKMLGGYFDIVELSDADGEPFQIYMIDAPEYDSYQVFVSPYVYD